MGKKEGEKIKKEIEDKKKEEDRPYDVDSILKVYTNNTNKRIIKILKAATENFKSQNQMVEYDVDKILKELNEDDKKNKNNSIEKVTLYQRLKELEKAKLIFSIEISNDKRPKKFYFIGENQKKRIDRIEEILEAPIDKIPLLNELDIIARLLEEKETMDKSKEFMKRVPDGGWMDICFPAESAKFVVLPPYPDGYKGMKERGIRIRVITEFTTDNTEFCLKMIKERMVDEIRHLKNIKCGFAVSKNQYMAAFLAENKSKEKFMEYVAYSGDKSMIKYGQALFDICWDNAVSFLKNPVN